MKEVVLYTSGLDSYILREYLLAKGHDIQCVYFNHGGRYTQHEKRKILSLPFDVTIDESITLKDIETEDAHIPHRNFLFSLMAAARYSDKIWIGGSLSDRVEDNNKEVFKRFSRLLSDMHQKNICIDSPFFECYKEDMIKWFVDYVPIEEPVIELVKRTFSCFNPVRNREVEATRNGNVFRYNTEECLHCPACFRKSASLYSEHVFINTSNESLIDKYYIEFNSDIIQTPRSITTLGYIDAWKKINS